MIGAMVPHLRDEEPEFSSKCHLPENRPTVCIVSVPLRDSVPSTLQNGQPHRTRRGDPTDSTHAGCLLTSPGARKELEKTGLELRAGFPAPRLVGGGAEGSKWVPKWSAQSVPRQMAT